MAISSLMVFLTSMLPIWELKGAIPMGIGLGIPAWEAYFLALLGSSIPVIFIIIFIERIIIWMSKSKVSLFNKVANWILKKVDKHKSKIDKYGYFAVFLFVAIPLPGTGVWTGSLLASMLSLSPKKAIPIIIIGNAIAGLIMMLLSDIFFPHVTVFA